MSGLEGHVPHGIFGLEGIPDLSGESFHPCPSAFTEHLAVRHAGKHGKALSGLYSFNGDGHSDVAFGGRWRGIEGPLSCQSCPGVFLLLVLGASLGKRIYGLASTWHLVLTFLGC